MKGNTEHKNNVTSFNPESGRRVKIRSFYGPTKPAGAAFEQAAKFIRKLEKKHGDRFRVIQIFGYDNTAVDVTYTIQKKGDSK